MMTPAPLDLPAPSSPARTLFSSGRCSTVVIGVAFALALGACGQKPAAPPAEPAATAGQSAAGQAPVLDTDEEKVLNV